MSFPVTPLGALLRESLRNGKSARASANGEGVRVFTLTAVTKADFSEENTKISVLRAADVEDVWAEPGDIFIERSNTPDLVGTAALYTGRRRFAVFPDLLIRVRTNERVEERFLAYFLRSESARRYFRSNARGIAGTMPKISQQTIESLPVPVPDRAEQARIVAAIETHSSRLDAAVASLTRAKANVKRARASVLKAAVEGRLVPTEAALARAEGREYEPASVLLGRIRAEREAAWAASGARGKYKEPVKPETEGLPGLPEGWCWASVDQAAHEVRNGFSGKPTDYGPVRILRISAVRPRSVDRNDHRYLAGCIEDYRSATAMPGDLLVTRYNGSRDFVGVMGLVRGDQPVVHPDKLIRVRLAAPAITAAWFEVAFNAGASRGFIEGRIRTTAGQAGVSGADLKAVPVPLPPLAEQHRIVADVDRRLSVLDALDATLDVNLARCARLRQAVLKRAFEGRLVPAEATDEAPPLAAEQAAATFGQSS